MLGVVQPETSKVFKERAGSGFGKSYHHNGCLGGIVAIDPHTGRVLAIVGGFSFSLSQFDRATQAKRQPGSAFKPLVYVTALDNGYKPTTIVLDRAGRLRYRSQGYTEESFAKLRRVVARLVGES